MDAARGALLGGPPCSHHLQSPNQAVHNTIHSLNAGCTHKLQCSPAGSPGPQQLGLRPSLLGTHTVAQQTMSDMPTFWQTTLPCNTMYYMYGMQVAAGS